jgi:lysozyme family protein
MRAAWSRRQFAGGAGASILALAAGASARGQGLGQQLEGLLGGKLPQQLQSILPSEVFEVTGFVRSLLALEGEAKALRLPRSILSRKEGDIPLDPEQLYGLAMPRLVALIDRSERRNPLFSEKAGALLAKLHSTQHEVPEALREVLSRAAEPLAGGSLAFGGQVEDPPAAPAEPVPTPAPVPATVSEPVVQPLPQPSDAPQVPVPEDAPEAPERLSRSIRFADLSEEYRALFAAAQIRPERREQAEWHLAMMRQARPRYAAIGGRVGVPWQFIAAIHGMEASFNFRAHLHNGDHPLNQRTRQVPAGRPLRWLPPSDWESSALDALRLLGFTNQSDWSLARTLHRLEAFNGFGYRRIGKPSPYLWSFTTAYERGKYVADGRYDPRARSQQCGTAAMLKVLADAGELDLTA